MPLPTSRELREVINAAAPAPWFVETMYERDPCGGEAKRLWLVGKGYYFVAETSAPASTAAHHLANFRLAALAPQLAEEVIRLREEIDRLKWYCLDSVQVAEAEARLADGEREKARQEGRAEAYYGTYLQITQGQHKENQ